MMLGGDLHPPHYLPDLRAVAVREQKLMAGEAEKVPLAKLANRIVGVGVIPYPPGIPIVMPGENIGAADGPWIRYLHTLEEWGHKFPGFAKEVEGTEEKDGTFYVYCLK